MSSVYAGLLAAGRGSPLEVGNMFFNGDGRGGVSVSLPRDAAKGRLLVGVVSLKGRGLIFV